MLCIDSSGKYWRVRCRLNVLTHWGLVTPYDGGVLGSGYGLLPGGTMPLPEPMLTDHQSVPLVFIWGPDNKNLSGANELSVVNEWYGPQLVQLGRPFNWKYHDKREKLCLWNQPNERFPVCHRLSGSVYAASETTQTSNSHHQANVVSQWLIWLGDVLPWGHSSNSVYTYIYV